MHRTLAGLSAVLIAVALVDCTRTDDAARDTLSVDTAAGAIGAPVSPAMPGPDTGGAAGTDTGAVGETDLIHIRLREWAVAVSKSPIRAGRTTFHAMNEGTNQHAAEIEGNGQEWETPPIAPGGTATLTVNLRPGTYTVYCPIVDTHGNHRERGMSTTLVVQ